MREVISVHLGQTGVQMGNALWELFCLEHGVPCDGLQPHRINFNSLEDVEMRQNCLINTSSGDLSTEPLFIDSSNGRLVPRALFIDLEPTVIDEVRTGSYRQLFHPENLITGKDDASNNFARGRFSTGKPLLNLVMEQVRRLLDTCDSPSAFLFYHAHGGGTGGGFGSLLMDNLSKDMAKLTKINFMLYPSTAMSNSVVEPYNAVLSLENSINKSDCTVHMENSPLYALCQQCLNVCNPTYTSINRLCAQAISTLTASLRFFNSDRMDIWQLQTNLVPYPRIHFPLVAFAPVLSPERLFHNKITVGSVTQDLFHPRSQFVDCDPRQGKYMASFVCYRGLASVRDANEAIAKLKATKGMQFVDWCPTGFKLILNRYAPVRVPGSDMAAGRVAAAMMTNTTAVNESFARLIRKFSLMHNMRAYVHWYVGEGMEEGEFIEAKDSVLSLEKDYKELALATEEAAQDGEQEPTTAPSDVNNVPRIIAPQPRLASSQHKSGSVHSQSDASPSKSMASKSMSDAPQSVGSISGSDSPTQKSVASKSKSDSSQPKSAASKSKSDIEGGADEKEQEEDDEGGGEETDANDGGGGEETDADDGGGGEETDANKGGGDEEKDESEPEEASDEQAEADESKNTSAVPYPTRYTRNSPRKSRTTGFTFQEVLAKHHLGDHLLTNKTSSSNNSLKNKPNQRRFIVPTFLKTNRNSSTDNYA